MCEIWDVVLGIRDVGLWVWDWVGNYSYTKKTLPFYLLIKTAENVL